MYNIIFLKNYYNRNLTVLGIFYNETDFKQLFKKSYESGNLLAMLYIREDKKLNYYQYDYDDLYYDYDDDDSNDDDSSVFDSIDDDFWTDYIL